LPRLDHLRDRGAASLSWRRNHHLGDSGAKLAHEVRTEEAFDDWGEASQRVEHLAREWIDGKRG
jgi:hypothetical protein